MKTHHVHVEAAAIALVVMICIAIIDMFIDLADGSPYKVIGYIVGFWLVYGMAYPVRRRAWNR